MLKLNLGCGPHTIDGWINYDLESHPNITQLDLSLGRLPHPDNSVDFIFSEHFIEHVTKQQAVILLKECYRVLKPGGVIRISTPDLQELINWYQKDRLVNMHGVWEPKSCCDMVNEGLTFWGHKYLWDSTELYKYFLIVDFSSVSFFLKGQSGYRELQNLEVRPQYFEMYVEAKK